MRRYIGRVRFATGHGQVVIGSSQERLTTASCCWKFDRHTPEKPGPADFIFEYVLSWWLKLTAIAHWTISFHSEHDICGTY